MKHFEKEALRNSALRTQKTRSLKTLKKPEVWFRYVDDTFVI